MSSDPYVAKAESNASPAEKYSEIQEILKGAKTGMLVTRNADGSLHARAMAPASKDGLVFDFLANNNSGKFDELQANPEVNVSFFNPSTSDWVSVSGSAKTSTDVEKIKSLYDPSIKAWFGDEGGQHTGEPGDPRISAIEITPSEIRYWKQTSTALGQAFQVAKGTITGSTAAPGNLRQISASELAIARQAHKV